MTERVDVAVVGAGMAGWTAARRSQELGLSVAVVDKGPSPGACNARVSQGFMNAAYLSMREDPQLLRDYVREITSGAVDEDLLLVWSENCARALTWLSGQGADIGTLPERRDRLYLLPFKVSPQGLVDVDPERGPAATITRHAEAFDRAGGAFLGESQAEALLTTDSGAVDGVRIQSPGGSRDLRADAVVLADGGFQGNPEMLRRHVGPAAHLMKLRSLGTQTGDGIAMALEVGAATVNMRYFYGHMLSLDALTNDDLWPYPLMDGAICDGVLVRGDGRRFVDEQVAGTGGSRRAMSGIGVTNVVGQSDDPRDAIAILDAAGWALKGWDKERGEFQGTYPANPTIPDRGGRVFSSDSLAGLAEQAGIAATALEQTIADYNAAVRAGRAGELPVPRSGDARVIEEPPFVAVPCVAGITYTLGGLHITPEAQVRDTSGGVVPRLYAAGGTAGGLAGGAKGGYTGGLGEALVFGLLAAEHIAGTRGT